jgi:hypothetical protein
MQVILQGSLRHFRPDELLPFVCRRTERGTLDLEAAGKRARILFRNTTILAADPFDVVLESFDWPNGSFTLLDDVALPEGATPLDLALDALLEQAKQRAAYRDNTLFRVVDDPALQQQVSLTADEFRLLFRLANGRTFKDLLADLPIPRTELADRLKHLETLGLVTTIREEPEADATAPQKKTVARKRTLVGSLTPDGALDNVWPLLDSEYTIGRAPANAISIADGSVSSHHARITRTPEGFLIEDLQSRNGTFVNGEKVTEKRLLTDGDLIRVGKVIMTFNVARESRGGDTTQPEVKLA